MRQTETSAQSHPFPKTTSDRIIGTIFSNIQRLDKMDNISVIQKRLDNPSERNYRWENPVS
jgi:hypothetical protein